MTVPNDFQPVEFTAVRSGVCCQGPVPLTRRLRSRDWVHFAHRQNIRVAVLTLNPRLVRSQPESFEVISPLVCIDFSVQRNSTLFNSRDPCARRYHLPHVISATVDVGVRVCLVRRTTAQTHQGQIYTGPPGSRRVFDITITIFTPSTNDGSRLLKAIFLKYSEGTLIRQTSVHSETVGSSDIVTAYKEAELPWTS